MWKNRNSHSLLLGMQNGTAISEDSVMVSTKLNILLLYDQATVLLGPVI